MKTKIYYIGLLKRENNIHLQASSTKDGLSCEVNEYLGARITTKAHLKENKKNLLNEFKKIFPSFQSCKRLIID